MIRRFPSSLFSTPGLVLIAVMISGLGVPVGAILFAAIPDDAKVEEMVMERFEARYHEEELVDLHAIWLANEDVFIRGIMWKYYDKLQRLARTCQALKDGEIQSDVVYTPQKWQYLPPELRGTPQ